VIIIANTLLTEVLQQFDAAVHQDRCAGNVKSARRCCFKYSRRHPLGCSIANPISLSCRPFLRHPARMPARVAQPYTSTDRVHSVPSRSRTTPLGQAGRISTSSTSRPTHATLVRVSRPTQRCGAFMCVCLMGGSCPERVLSLRSGTPCRGGDGQRDWRACPVRP